jgi:serine/threonine protein kinase
VIPSAVTATACQRCGAQNDLSSNYCANCGTEVVTSLPPTERQHPAQRPGKSVPPAARISVAPPPSRERHHADPLIGRVVAERYRVLELIGRGGMGVVYRAEHARIGKILALKLLTGELTRDAGQVARFKREALMASKLSHPNTVQVFDFGDADGLAYLAMEYVRGTDLGSVVSAAGQLGHERAARLVVQVCSSLAEAHEKGIVHRDLKPENIMIVHGQSGEDVVKVLDFGLAKLRESSELSDVTSSGAIVGTPYYMSPEQIRGEAIGPPSDVYALGAVLYACLTGTVVFDAPTPMGVLTRHLIEQPQPPSARSPGVNIPKGLERLVLQALEKDPAKRFASAGHMQEALLAELRGGGSASSLELLLDSKNLRNLAATDEDAATRDEVERYERKLRRRDLALFGVAGALLLMAVAGGVRVYRSFTARPAFQGVELEPNNAASEALGVPFPLDVKGRLGQRLDKSRSDRDFYRLVVPAGADAVSLAFEPLPNLGSCLWLYPPGSQEPFGRYCLGAGGVRLATDALRLAPGEWVIAVMQDREAYFEGGAAPVHENVSDDYRLVVRPTRPVPERETEPNDAPPLGNSVAAGGVLRAALGWARDTDLVCAAPGAAKVRFAVDDAIERPRSHYSVLQVTMRGGPDDGIPVRVHRAGAKVQASPRDVVGTWKSPPVKLDASAPPCVELTLVPNPWGPTPAALVAPPGDEEYLVRVEAL